ncbi:hypothetical protein OZX74_03730 [Bifidobacterium sp. ESL0798]|uniref:hypothetical protein n=1 Tax=Bifidobacterium sp. ESL0798 TaxID=2983235 RepID=UPI0023F693D8|nr:hypothetical protein [Bifidobacterium sp. ESL0798]WEV74637.1 hypothetical protein OZX74_03730 [Bifidobacterium sp. ESL0798]
MMRHNQDNNQLSRNGVDKIVADMLDPDWYGARREEYGHLLVAYPALRQADRGLDGLVCYMVIRSLAPGFDADTAARIVLACLTDGTDSGSDGSQGGAPATAGLAATLFRRLRPRRRDDKGDGDLRARVGEVLARHRAVLAEIAGRMDDDARIRGLAADINERERHTKAYEEEAKRVRGETRTRLEEARDLADEARGLRDRAEATTHRDGAGKRLDTMYELMADALAGKAWRDGDGTKHVRYAMTVPEMYASYYRPGMHLITAHQYLRLDKADRQGWTSLDEVLRRAYASFATFDDARLKGLRTEIRRRLADAGTAPVALGDNPVLS